MNLFFKEITGFGFILTAIAAVLAFCLAGWVWSLGIFVGHFWLFLNMYVLFQLIEMGMKPNPNQKNKILALTIIKFPVIYLTGFFILKSRFFPVYSLVAGLSIFMAVFLFGWLKFNIKKTFAVLVLGVLIGSASVYAATPKVKHSDLHAAASHESHTSKDHHEEGGEHHLANFVSLTADLLGDTPLSKTLRENENIIFGLIVIAILSGIFYAASRKISLIPGRLQAGCEAVIEGLFGFVSGILGPENGRRYSPFLGTLFLYIWTMNLIGLVPLMKSNTANSITLTGPVALPIPTTTVALAIIVFIYVQFIGITKQGIVGYLDHMAGTPRDVFGWVMTPIMLPIHLIGELAKPFSLTFRLFCNIMGGHILVAVFIGMAIGAYFIPFQAPFLIFEIATSTIQAFVFTLLSTVYIAMMLPHDDHAHEHGGAEHAKHH